MTVFRKNIIVGNNNTLISLKSIESINSCRDIDDQTFDKLKGDLVFIVNTKGGNTYNISVELQRSVFESTLESTFDNLNGLRDAIIEKWIHLIS